MANLITLGRVLLIFLVIGVWNREVHLETGLLDLLMVPLLAGVIFLDAVDGWVARKRQETSEAGALFDIAGDRIVELVIWIFFAVRRDASGVPFIPLWIPLVMIARTVLTDLVRSAALRHGRTPFGDTTLQEAWWAKQLTSARWSRTVYGVLKAAAFCALGLALAWERLAVLTELEALWRAVTATLVYATVFFGVLRGLPVLWEGRRYMLPEVPPAAPAVEPQHESRSR